MSEYRDPTAPTVSGSQQNNLPAGASYAPANPNQNSYQQDAAAKYNLRVERDPSVTPALAEDSMAQVRAAMGRGVPQPAVQAPGQGIAYEAQRHARMAELATYNRFPELSTSAPLQEQTQEAPAAIRPSQLGQRPLQNLRGSQAEAKPILGKWTQLANSLRGRQNQVGSQGQGPQGQGR